MSNIDDPVTRPQTFIMGSTDKETAAQTIPAQPLFTVNRSSFNAVAVSLVTGALRIAGGAAVAHGFATQGMVDSAIGPLAQEIAGSLIALGAQAWATWYSKHKHDKLVQVGDSVPDTVLKVQ